MIFLKIAQKLKSRRAAQFYLVIYSSKMEIWHIFAILGTLHISIWCKVLMVDRMDSWGKNESLFEKIGGCTRLPEWFWQISCKMGCQILQIATFFTNYNKPTNECHHLDPIFMPFPKWCITFLYLKNWQSY